ncbi:MAG: hypothetical protein ABL925_02680 [Methylococcales bacterium]
MYQEKDALYQLLPADLRSRDRDKEGNEGNGPLRGLLAIIGHQASLMEQDIANRMYNDWFIETCQDWVVAYIGDLLGYERMPAPNVDSNTISGQKLTTILSPRREIANLIAYRRRKGTLWILEELARDVANWPARAVEFYRLLARTEHIDHPQPQRLAVADLRDTRKLEMLGTPFDTFCHTVDVRRISNQNLSGRYNIPNVGLYVFRTKRYQVTKTSAYSREEIGLHCFTFSILGNDAPLYSIHVPELEPTSLAEEYNFDLPIRRRSLEVQTSNGFQGYELLILEVGVSNIPNEGQNLVIVNFFGNELHIRIFDKNGVRVIDLPENDLVGKDMLPSLKKQLKLIPDKSHISPEQQQKILQDVYRLQPISVNESLYGEGKSLVIYAANWPKKGPGLKDNDEPTPIDAKRVISADLSGWAYQVPKNYVAIDPVIGRIQFPKGQAPRNNVLVSYGYGFLADIGGGEYERSAIPLPTDKNHFLINPDWAKDLPDDRKFRTIDAAFHYWRTTLPDKEKGLEEEQKTWRPAVVIELVKSGVFKGHIDIELKDGELLCLVASNHTRPIIWLSDENAGGPDSITIRGGKGARVIFDGLMVTGRGIDVIKNDMSSDDTQQNDVDLCEVVFRHSTLVPGWGLHCDCAPKRTSEPSLFVENTSAKIRIESSIVGAIKVNTDPVMFAPTPITVCDSIIDATSIKSVAIGSSDTGIAYVELRIARSTIVGEILAHAILLAENSLFTSQVQVARKQLGCIRYSYVPIGSRTPKRYRCQPESEQVPHIDIQRLTPCFESMRYGTSNYLRLSNCAALEIKRGADDESEMGVYHDLFEPQRLALLTRRLQEFVPASTDSAVIFAS